MERNSNNAAHKSPTVETSPICPQEHGVKISQKTLASPTSELIEFIEESPIPQKPSSAKKHFVFHKPHSLSSVTVTKPSGIKEDVWQSEIWQSAAQRTQQNSAESKRKNGAQSVVQSRDPSAEVPVSALNFEKRVKFYGEKHRTHLAINKIQAETEEQIECTFRPFVKRGLKRSQSEGRCFANFLKKQHDYTEERAWKVDLSSREKLTMEQGLLRQTPTINAKSSEIAKLRKNCSRSTVYARLHSTENCRKRRVDAEQEPKPKPSHKRALNKSVHILSNRHTKEHTNVSQPEARFMSQKDAGLVVKKIEKELTELFTEFSENPNAAIPFNSLCINPYSRFRLHIVQIRHDAGK